MSVKSFKTGTRSISMLAGNTPEHHVLIGDVTVGAGGTASVTFSNIDQSYQHLQIRALHRTARAATADNIFVQVNGDAAATYYAMHQLNGNGTSAASNGWGFNTAGNNGLWGHYGPAANSLANVFGVFIMDILDYTSTSKFKTAKSLGGTDTNGNDLAYIQFASSFWGQTAAITSLRLISQNGSNISQYSTFQLYGVK